jgi:hypothetical protein
MQENQPTANDGRKFDHGGRFISNCDDVLIDGPADHTVRPIPPRRLAQAMAERAKVYGPMDESANQPPPQAPPNDPK